MNFKIASIVNDKALLERAKTEAEKLCGEDTELKLAKNLLLKMHLQSQKHKNGWGKIA
ncbi:MAG: hypothetical protein NVS3B15_05590 [Sediminibacterium sp.]